jgi:hypothetical protein
MSESFVPHSWVCQGAPVRSVRGSDQSVVFWEWDYVCSACGCRGHSQVRDEPREGDQAPDLPKEAFSPGSGVLVDPSGSCPLELVSGVLSS